MEMVGSPTDCDGAIACMMMEAGCGCNADIRHTSYPINRTRGSKDVQYNKQSQIGRISVVTILFFSS